jgi:hypothetical protein
MGQNLFLEATGAGPRGPVEGRPGAVAHRGGARGGGGGFDELLDVENGADGVLGREGIRYTIRLWVRKQKAIKVRRVLFVPHKV